MIKKVISYLHLNNIGLLELLFALYPILSGYNYGGFTLGLFALIVMDIMAYSRCPRPMKFRPLLFLAIFVILHEVLLCLFLDTVPTYHINTIISYIIFLFSIFIIAPALNFKKLLGAIYFVAILSMAGIFYHFIIVKSGGVISPIKLPFLPDLASDARLYGESVRPCSFYWEPAAFVTYMMVPLFLSLYERKFMWSAAIMFSMFLSTSSTGIILSITMVAIYVITQKTKLQYKLVLVFMGAGMTFFLLNSSLFEAGVNKIENTDIETSVRLVNGPKLVSNMPAEHIVFGIPSPNVNEYYRTGQLVGVNLVAGRSGFVFVSTFWLMLAKFGIVGLMLYLYSYYRVLREDKRIAPYLLVLIISLFSQGFLLSAIFTFQFVFMLAFIKFDTQHSIQN